MIDIRDEIEYLENENVTEEKFWGMLALNEDDGFDYGRDVLKEGTYETQMVMPYDLFPLFHKRDWFKDEIQKPVLQIQGILRSGKPSGAMIKGRLEVCKSKEKEEDDEEEKKED